MVKYKIRSDDTTSSGFKLFDTDGIPDRFHFKNPQMPKNHAELPSMQKVYPFMMACILTNCVDPDELQQNKVSDQDYTPGCD